MKKKFLVMKVKPQQWKKILAGTTFIQIFLSNQRLKEQDIKACSIADKNKVLTKNGSFTVPFAGCQLSFASQPSLLSRHQTACRTSLCKRFASTIAEDPF